MADRDKALEDYKAGLSYKEIAEKHNVSESTVKSWASRHWNNDKKIQKGYYVVVVAADAKSINKPYIVAYAEVK